MMAPHSHVPHLERRRVVGRWEELVSKAIDAKGKRPFLRLSRGEYEDTVVPQFLQEQNNKISDILQTAHDVENDYPIVARICTWNYQPPPPPPFNTDSMHALVHAFVLCPI